MATSSQSECRGEEGILEWNALYRGVSFKRDELCKDILNVEQ